MGLRMRLRALFRRDAVERELDDEIRFHIEMQTEENLRSGMSPAEARRRALVDFGGVERHKEASRDTRGTRWLQDAGRDARYAARALRRSPGFALAAVATVGLGIGANTAIFGVVDALFVQTPAGVRGADRVVRLYMARDEGNIQSPDGGAGSYVDYLAIRDRVPGLAATAAFMGVRDVDLDRGERARRIRASSVTQNYFSVLGVRAGRGRLFLPSEDSVLGAHPVAVVSDAFWRGHFGSDPAVLGKTLLVNGQVLTVVGVAQEGFTGIEPDPVDVWVTMAMASPLGFLGASGKDWRPEPMMIMISVIGRMKPGATPHTVAAAATVALVQAARGFPDQGLDPTPRVIPGSLIPAGGPTRSRAADLALSLVAVTAIVLVIACANVANLLLARGATRRRETAIRLSVGAGRGRLIRQHLTESLVLSLLGGALGLLLAFVSTGLIRQFPLPPAAARLDTRSLLFALGLTLATGLVFGVVPALQAARADTVSGLKEGAGGAGLRGRRVRSALVGVQVALSVTLLVGAGLFIRSLGEVHAVRPGADVDRLLLVSADLAKAGYGPVDREAFYAAARERVVRMPGVERATMGHFPPMARSAMGYGIEVPGRGVLEMDDGPLVNWVAPGYFATTGTRILRGRDIADADRTGEPVALVNESLARILAPGGDPVGSCISVAEQTRTKACTRIVGVVENQRRTFLEEKVTPFVFLARDRDPDAISWGGPTLVVRTRGDAGALAGEVRSTLQSMDPRLPFVAVESLASVIRPEILPYRLGASLFGLFGVLALILAGVGLYGSLGYFVAERRPEIGIRRSLGAEERHVVSLVLREGMLPVLGGLAVGLAAAAGGVRLVESLLFGVPARDLASFAAAAFFLTCVAAAASYLPARRAARVDPMVALRAQ